jgi:diguanylate cyclase (GGDEF)-like protein
MRKEYPAVELHPFSAPATFRVVAIQVICLCAAGLIAIGALVASLFQLSAHGVTSEWIGRTLDPVIASLGCAASLAFSIARPSKIHLTASRILACAAAVPALLELLNRWHGPASTVVAIISPDPAVAQPAAMPPVVAITLVLLAALLLAIRSSRNIASYIADCIAFVLGLLILAMVSGWLFTFAHVVGSSTVDRTPPAALCMLAPLIFVAFTVRAQYGAFDILVGTGIGSRIARALAPVLIALPFLREASRIRIIRLHLIPEHSEAAIFGATAAMLSLGFLVLISRHIRRMETEIQQLSFRDELTGLYNLRGFRLLAEQALRLAHRSQTPFSILFVDLDGLKQINDTLGHAVGSALLVETAGLLNATFRETDVIARIGGDEFAVAGQFTHTGISIAAQRLEDQASATPIKACGGQPLRLSVGYSTNNEHRHESLQDLLDRADMAMYNDKRRKRLRAC